ncbi:uncharacterized protein [Musca autumnalis]|uniref:uncharacterized protein n=1 Tax=Musca autumnalis TaxID=221902 RepID=UPI003CE69DD9
MPSFCAVLNCNDRYGHSDNISFHKFPLKRKDLLEQWESFIQKQRGPDWRASRWSSLCSRHFREDDFRSLNERKTLKKTAVPSILEEVNHHAENNNNKPEATYSCGRENESEKDKEFKEILAIREQLEDVGGNTNNVAKTNCRLCGVTSIPVVTFASNYELYGMLQKCFPTLNIQQDDVFPKVLCSSCYKNLQHFCEFVDVVWAAQTELQKKYKPKAAERPPLKIKQEPLAVRVKQEVAEVGYDQQQQHEMGANDDYDVMADGQHDDGEGGGEAVDQKYEFCDFPINDCDIMEIINLDDPFINIPDDDNNTIVNESCEEEQKREPPSSHMPTAHELLQVHLLMDEHNYAYVDTDDFKEEQQVYKTEKYDGDERSFLEQTNITKESEERENHNFYKDPGQNYIQEQTFADTHSFENRALKPIVTSVSAIQQPTNNNNKGNGIVVLNESIVKSGAGGCQLHSCMVCHLKFFSVENLKEHYTQTHGTPMVPPMVTVPTSNILVERNSTESKYNMKTEVIENVEISSAKDVFETPPENLEQQTKEHCESNENQKDPSNEEEHPHINDNPKTNFMMRQRNIKRDKITQISSRRTNYRRRNIVKKNPHKISLNIMANQYQQLRKLYQTLQKKCLNLEQNVEQLQLQPITKTNRSLKDKRKSKMGNATSPHKQLTANAVESKIFACPVCSKIFPNSNSLRQHSITHTEERKHICSLCQRCFKRRNGLLQHLKGFHLQVKPFTCEVCKHSYALKCDMLRCKHSALKSASVVLNKCP